MNAARRTWIFSLAAALAAGGGGAALAQTTDHPPPATIVFHFERPGLPVPEFTTTLHEDGSGTYAAKYQDPGAVADVSRPILLSHDTTSRLFERVRSTNRMSGGCESKQKNIAFSGSKTISYSGPDGAGTCTFNFTENKSIGAIADTFLAVAETLDEGRAIEMKHRYDRLGLDRELINLQTAVKEGRATDVITIAPVLQSLCDDMQVMERVRKRAAGLLEASTPAH